MTASDAFQCILMQMVEKGLPSKENGALLTTAADQCLAGGHLSAYLLAHLAAPHAGQHDAVLSPSSHNKAIMPKHAPTV
jgi:hypothetical protein